VNKEKLLLISCYFPPVGGIQVQRALSLARYLPENGFEVHVLTVRNPAVPSLDPDLLKLVPEGVKVHRTWTLEPPFQLRKRLWSSIKSKPKSSKPDGKGPLAKLKMMFSRMVARILCPDPQVLWFPFAYWKASRLIQREGIQTVVVTAPPFSAFLILNALKRRYPRIHAIADIRDEWLRYFVKEFVFQDDDYVSARAAQIERETVRSCETVVVVTKATQQELQSRYPDEPDAKFALVPNGFEESAFTGFRSRPHNTGKLVIAYTGTVYNPSSPKTFLDALDQLPREIGAEIECRFIGRIAEEFDRTVFQNRNSSVRLTGFVPQQEAIFQMEECDVLLLPWRNAYTIPGKLFEYLATGKPLLALTYPGWEIESIIHEANAGWCVHPDDHQAIIRTLLEIHACGGRLSGTRNWQAIKRYERRRLTQEYARAIRRTAVLEEEVIAHVG
jgi:glycosyltransferase involved in cell wall biosynthesis